MRIVVRNGDASAIEEIRLIVGNLRSSRRQ
jgi:hypothetical protein